MRVRFRLGNPVAAKAAKRLSPPLSAASSYGDMAGGRILPP